MRPRSVSNSGSTTPPRPNRRAVSLRSPPPARSERTPPPLDDQKPEIVIFNLAEETTEDELRSHFQSSGQIKELSIAKSINGGHIGFVTFFSIKQADKAIRTNKKSVLNGSTIDVQRAIKTHLARVPKKECHKEGNFVRKFPVTLQIVPEELDESDCSETKLALTDSFTKGEFVFPSGRQDSINQRSKIDRPQEVIASHFKGTKYTGSEVPKQQQVIKIEDSPVRQSGFQASETNLCQKKSKQSQASQRPKK